jgi:hypothetical protein
MDAVDKAWVAGILEGEGNFYVGQATVRGNTYTQIKVRVGACDKDMIEELARLTGYGKARLIQPPSRNPHWSPHYLWEITSRRQAREILEQIIPYMRVSRRIEAAEKVLAETYVDRRRKEYKDAKKAQS